jgi:hypothetical protein
MLRFLTYIDSMKIKLLIENLFTSEQEVRDNALIFVNENSLSDSEVPPNVAEFIFKFYKRESLKKDDFDAIEKYLAELEENDHNLHDIVSGMLNDISYKIIKSYGSEIEKFTKEIEVILAEGNPLDFEYENKIAEYQGLLNVYGLTNGTPLPLKKWGGYFPGMSSARQTDFCYSLSFSINVLNLMKKLPSDYNGISVEKPLYPNEYSRYIQIENIEKKRGIKQSDSYFPYKKISKIQTLGAPDTTFVATNGKKILYLRGSPGGKLTPHSILGSKIATFVSKDHFSSERLLDNRIIGSKKLPSYAISLVNLDLGSLRNYLIENQIIIPGMGIVDETLNFICEFDPNPENFALSSHDFSRTHLCKIDFDFCNLEVPISKEKYEKDIFSQVDMRFGDAFKDNIEYIEEKLLTRLKLCFLTPDFIDALAKKAYLGEADKNRAVSELVSRTNVALKLFMQHPSSSLILKKYPDILDTFWKESVFYVNRHFDEPVAEKIIHSLENRFTLIKKEIDELLLPKKETEFSSLPYYIPPPPPAMLSDDFEEIGEMELPPLPSMPPPPPPGMLSDDFEEIEEMELPPLPSIPPPPPPGIEEIKKIHEKKTSLCIAAEQGNLELCIELINAGENVDAQDSNGSFPLIVAAGNGFSDVCLALIKAGANVNVRDGLGFTPLILAASKGLTEVCIALIAAGADINTKSKAKSFLDILETHPDANFKSSVNSVLKRKSLLFVQNKKEGSNENMPDSANIPSKKPGVKGLVSKNEPDDFPPLPPFDPPSPPRSK